MMNMILMMLLDRRPRFVVVNGRAASDGVHRLIVNLVMEEEEVILIVIIIP